MQTLDKVLSNEQGSISILNTQGYTSLQLSGMHAHNLLKLDEELCQELSTAFEFEFLTSSNSLVASNLAKTSFFENLPSRPFYINTGDANSERKHLLNPSVCYHCFDHYSRTYEKSTQLLSSVAKCFRNEDTSVFNPFRLCEFTMREFVVIGDSEQVKEIGKTIFETLTRYINNKIAVECLNACDSFMGGNIAVLQKVQKALGLKQELVFQTPFGPISTASVNWHKKTMTSRYIEIEGIESCCIAIGLERLYLGIQQNAN